MNAFVCDRTDIALALVRRLAGVRASTDGPFRVWHGAPPDADDDTKLMVIAAADDVELQYAAGRIAARRGCEVLIHLGLAHAAPAALERAGFSIGDAVPISSVTDLRSLAHLQRTIPQLPPRLPSLKPFQNQAPVWPIESAPEDAPRLGTVALPLTVPALAEKLASGSELALFDCGAAGLLAAGSEDGLPVFVVKIVAGPAGPNWTTPTRGEADRLTTGVYIERLVDSLIGETPQHSTAKGRT